MSSLPGKAPPSTRLQGLTSSTAPDRIVPNANLIPQTARRAVHGLSQYKTTWMENGHKPLVSNLDSWAFPCGTYDARKVCDDCGVNIRWIDCGWFGHWVDRYGNGTCGLPGRNRLPLRPAGFPCGGKKKPQVGTCGELGFFGLAQPQVPFGRPGKVVFTGEAAGNLLTAIIHGGEPSKMASGVK